VRYCAGFFGIRQVGPDPPWAWQERCRLDVGHDDLVTIVLPKGIEH